MLIFVLVVLLLLPAVSIVVAHENSCLKAGAARLVSCGHENAPDVCQQAGCCWEEVIPNPHNLPWCFNKTSLPPPAPTTNPWGLPELLHIDWRRLGDLPIGVEDCSGGFMDNETLVAGFGLGCPTPTAGEATGCFTADCKSSHDEVCWSRPGALLDVANAPPGHHFAWFSRMYVAKNVSGARFPQQWSELPLPPLSPRQGACGVTDPQTSSFFVAGGWTEWAPFPCGHTDAARLQRTPNGTWEWAQLPDLPHPVVFGSMGTANNKVYVFGADRYAVTWIKPTPACGKFPPTLYELDLNDLTAGWRSYPFVSPHIIPSHYMYDEA